MVAEVRRVGERLTAAPEGLNAPLFHSLIQRMEGGGRWIVLDLGAARSNTINAFGRFRCRLDIVDLAARSREKVNVIVVSPFADVRLYIEVMDHGAYDFITDSFTVPELVHVLRSAISSALLARERTTKLSAPTRQYPHPPPPSHP